MMISIERIYETVWSVCYTLKAFHEMLHMPIT